MSANQKKPRAYVADLGNNAVKPIAGSIDNILPPIQNIISVAGETRTILDYESSPYDGLHVSITSSALTNKFTGYVGHLASTVKTKSELSKNTKTTSDQTIIMLLTAVACDAVSSKAFAPNDEKIIESEYVLSTGLPIKEAKVQGSKKNFKTKIKNGTHEVKFLQTPEFGGYTVKIKFVDVVVNNEGQAGIFDLTMHPDGKEKNSELLSMTNLIHDIGGLSSDDAIITNKGIDNNNSDGADLGADTTLDTIIKRVSDIHGYKISSRSECVEIITSEKDRNIIYVNGKAESIKPIVDEELGKLAFQEYLEIEKYWQLVPSIRRCTCIGGGSLLLKSYLLDINDTRNQYPLEFVEGTIKSADGTEYPLSIWIIARSYFILLNMYVRDKGIELQEV